MNEKKKNNVLFKVLTILFLAFLISYILNVSGYYENKMHLKSTYTSEQISKFEEDVKNGVEVDTNEYVLDEEKVYANKFTKISDNLGNMSCKILGGGFSSVWEVVKALFM